MTLRRLITSFGRFWWEFLIGENPDAFVGTLVIIGSAVLLRHDRVAEIVTLPVLTIVVLVLSTYRSRQRA